ESCATSIFNEPITALEFTSKTATLFPIELIATTSDTTSKTTSVSHVIHTTNPEASKSIIVCATISSKGTLTVTVTAPTLSTTYSLWSLYIGSSNSGEPAATVTIEFPSDTVLETATIQFECGSLKWRGPNIVTKSFRSSITLGETNLIASPFQTKSLHAKTEKGSIKIANATVFVDAVLKTNFGGIDANISGYKELSASLSMGELKAQLTNPTPGSQTTLFNSLGGLSAKVSGFEGLFETSVVVGKVFVLAPGVKRGITGSGWHSGVVGDDENQATAAKISAKSSLGSVLLEFVE
ncbi:hypothetical protein HK100_005763, partial [Physocladia obscura]